MSIPSLLRPEQVEDNKNELKRLEHSLSQPQLQDPDSVRRQIRGLKHTLESSTPTPFSDLEVDGMVKLEKELRDKMVSDGMPTQAEMRHAPPGAVNKHMSWEARNKKNLLTWKYLKQRLDHESTDGDLCNFEKYRPSGGTMQLNLDNSIVPKESVTHIPPNAVHAVVMSDEQAGILKVESPELLSQMALLNFEDRQKVLDTVDKMTKARTKPKMSEEDRKAFGEKMAKARKDKKLIAASAESIEAI